jgi:hypothetical protein
VHGDPTFMVMDNLKRQFEQIVGTDITSAPFPSTGCARRRCATPSASTSPTT